MGVAYFIVLDKKDSGFETFVNGKAVARARNAICAATKSLGLKNIDDLTSFGELDEAFDLPEELRETETPWFEADEGIRWVDAVRRHIESNRSSIPDADRVLADLEEYDAVFRKGAGIGAKWHFQMDV
jgi:hypothetical protein